MQPAILPDVAKLLAVVALGKAILGKVTRDRLRGLVVSSWLQFRKPGFGSRYYQKKKVAWLERGPLSLVSTTEELLGRKSRGSCLETLEYGRRDPSR
jgi:hypothetical protein